MAGMQKAMISVVCPRGWVAIDVQSVAVTTVAPVSAPAKVAKWLEDPNPKFFPVDVELHGVCILSWLLCCWLMDGEGWWLFESRRGCFAPLAHKR